MFQGARFKRWLRLQGVLAPAWLRQAGRAATPAPFRALRRALRSLVKLLTVSGTGKRATF